MSSQKGVHHRIHTLRGEQFRHLQNLRGSRSHISSNNIHTVPSLPIRLLSLTDSSLNLTYHETESYPVQPKSNSSTGSGEPEPDGTSFRPPAGPTPPRSWTLNSKKDIRETPTWRGEALSLVLSHLVDQPPPLVASSTPDPSSDSALPAIPQESNSKPPIPRIPSLSLLCLQICLTICTTSEFRNEIMPYIPPHLRKDLVRFTAVHSPLSTARLYALWEPIGHADGEMIIVGPSAALKDDYFIRSHSGNGNGVVLAGEGDSVSKEPEDWDWDNKEIDMNLPLHSLILLNTSLSSSTLFSFPPTLTHLALINLSTPVPLHRLPNICPLIIILDVSYNAWLGANFGPDGQGRLGAPQPPRDPAIKAIVDLGRVDWSRLCHLKALGFRGNYVPENFLKGVNEGRWDDIAVIF